MSKITLTSRVPMRTLLSTSVALMLALPLVGHAEDSSPQTPDGSATTLDAVRVNAYRTTTHTSGATKTDTPVAEMAKSVSVIAREELDARGVQNLNEAMRYVAGVVLESGGIDNRVDDFRIRGFDAGSWSNNVTIDGMRAPQGGQWNRTMVDSWNLERVEVLKGPSAVMYGQVAPGGMVNQVSKTPTPTSSRCCSWAWTGTVSTAARSMWAQRRTTSAIWVVWWACIATVIRRSSTPSRSIGSWLPAIPSRSPSAPV